jgi:hypothetical protein
VGVSGNTCIRAGVEGVLVERHNQGPEAGEATYQIRVQGRLGEHWSEWFGGMAIELVDDDAASPITTLTGIVDQSALHGILARIRDLNLRLLSVVRLDEHDPPRGK